MADDILIGDTPKARARHRRQKDLPTSGRLWKHSRLTDIEQIVPPKELGDFFVFTLVRNPWDRMVSYYHWLRGQTFDHQAVRLAEQETFSGFLNHPHTRATLAAETAGGYVTTSAGQEVCDAFIRLEALDKDLKPLWDHLGFDLSPIAPANVSDRDRDYRHYYSTADSELVEKLFNGDIQRFGYRFE